jgi:hypothetical protein
MIFPSLPAFPLNGLWPAQQNNPGAAAVEGPGETGAAAYYGKID